MIRLGLIGCGEHSEIGHAVPLARYRSAHPDEVELAAACDIRPERSELFREKYGFLKSYSDVDQMLAAEKLDACIAVVPVERISTLGIMLLTGGIPCSLEKPLGSSPAEIAALADAARNSRTPHMVSVNRRFMPFLNRALEWTRGLGTVQYVRSILSRHARTEPEFLWATAVHAVDTLRYICGEVRSSSVQRIGKSETTGRWYVIDLDFESGARGRIDVLPTAGVLEESYELIGEGFRTIVISPFGPKRGLRCYRENRLVLEQVDEGISEDVVFGFYDEAAAFVRGVTEHKELYPTIADVAPSVELCLKLTKTAGLTAGL
jgi:predicted dehydrogenase